MEKHPIKLVVFDCDGVLFDSKMANKAFYNHICEKNHRRPLSDKDIDYVHVHTVDEAIDYLFEENPDLLQKASVYATQVDYTPFFRHMEIEPFLIEILNFLKSNLPVAVLTNRTTTMKALLKTFGLDDIFDMVVTAMDVKIPKPDPEGMKILIKKFNILPHEILYIGDSVIDQQVAATTGVFFASYKNINMKAHFYLDNLKDIKPIFSKPWTNLAGY